MPLRFITVCNDYRLMRAKPIIQLEISDFYWNWTKTQNVELCIAPLSGSSGLGADARIISGNTQSRQLNMVAYTPTNVYHWHNQCARPYHIQSSLSHKLELMPPVEFVAWFVDFEFYLINILGFLVGAKLPENWTKMAGDAEVHSFV